MSESKTITEFNDGRKLPPFKLKTSVSDWVKHSLSSKYTDETVESRLLSYLPFYPQTDGKRTAQIINTDIGDGNTIHEFYIENTEDSDLRSIPVIDNVKHMVLVHGYAVSLGLYFENFDALSSIPGIKLHAIDMLGFGLSSRPHYPKFPASTKEDIFKHEDWFIDALEKWRIRRGIDRFVLIGHSFGGYLSCAYAMKYDQGIGDSGDPVANRRIERLILLSPVGVERHDKSLLHGITHVSAVSEISHASPASPVSEISEIFDLYPGSETSVSEISVSLSASEKVGVRAQTENFVDPNKDQPWWSLTFKWLWTKNVSPFAVVRGLGPFKSKLVSKWTTHRFSHIYYQDPDHFKKIHDYFYRIFNATGSGEYAISKVLDIGVVAKLPLLDRCPSVFVNLKLPTLWVYGDKDWISRDAGLQMTREINILAHNKNLPPLAHHAVISNSGHHMYMDNPEEFAGVVFKFLNM